MRRSSRLAQLVLLTALFLGGCAAPGKVAAPPPAPGMPTATEYLARGIAMIDAAQALRMERSPMPAMGGVFGWPPDTEAYVGYYARARKDFQAILARFPDSSEAPEAQFRLGLINDHPHLNHFELALEAYRLTIDRYPGTEAAEKAKRRKEVIEKIVR